MFLRAAIFFYVISGIFVNSSHAWFDETHLAVAKVAGYQKWFNAAGPDVAKIKIGDKESHNHWCDVASRGKGMPRAIQVKMAMKVNAIARRSMLTASEPTRLLAISNDIAVTVQKIEVSKAASSPEYFSIQVIFPGIR